jgi:hypothetical protein
MPGSHISGLVGSLADAESMIALKDLLNRLGSENIESRCVITYTSAFPLSCVNVAVLDG